MLAFDTFQRLYLLELFPSAHNIYWRPAPHDGETREFLTSVGDLIIHNNPPVRASREPFGLKYPALSDSGYIGVVSCLTFSKVKSFERHEPNLNREERLSVFHVAKSCCFGLNTPKVLSFLLPCIIQGESTTSYHFVDTCIDQGLCSEFFLASSLLHRTKHLTYWIDTMDEFIRCLQAAAREGDFSLPHDFAYAGGNPLTVRSWLERQLQAQSAEGTDFLLLSLTINIFGTKLATLATRHPKYAKQGAGSQAMLAVAASVVQKYENAMPPGATLNSVASAIPEFGLLSMLGDASKPAPGVAQLNFRPEVKIP